MRKWAMILKNIVIDIAESEIEPNYPPDIEGNPVSAMDITNRKDVIILGKTYDSETDSFVETPPSEPIPQPEPELVLSSEELQAEILLNQQNIITRQETQELVLSQLLLNQQGGSVNV